MELTSSLSRLPTLMDNADDEETDMSIEIERKKEAEKLRKNPEYQKLKKQQAELMRRHIHFKRVFREKYPNDEIETMAEYIIKNREYMDNLRELSRLMKSSKK